MRRGRSWASASSSSTSTAVDAVFVFALRFSAGSCSLSNRIRDSCCGESDVERLAGQLEDLRRSATSARRRRAATGWRAPARRCGRRRARWRPAPASAAARGRDTPPSSCSVSSSGARCVASCSARSARSHGDSRARRSAAAIVNGTALAPRPHTSSSVSALVAEMLERRAFERMSRARRVEQVAGEHRVEPDAAQRDAVRGEHDHVGLEIVADLLDRRVLEHGFNASMASATVSRGSRSPALRSPPLALDADGSGASSRWNIDPAASIVPAAPDSGAGAEAARSGR